MTGRHVTQAGTFTAPPATLLLALAVGGAIILANALVIIAREARRLTRWLRSRPRPVRVTALEALPGPQFLAAPVVSPARGAPPWSPEPQPGEVTDTMVRVLPFGPQPPPRRESRVVHRDA